MDANRKNDVQTATCACYLSQLIFLDRNVSLKSKRKVFEGPQKIPHLGSERARRRMNSRPLNKLGSDPTLELMMLWLCWQAFLEGFTAAIELSRGLQSPVFNVLLIAKVGYRSLPQIERSSRPATSSIPHHCRLRAPVERGHLYPPGYLIPCVLRDARRYGPIVPWYPY